MKNIKFLFALVLGGMFFFSSCKDETSVSPSPAKEISTNDVIDFSNDQEMVDYYVRTIEEHKKNGSSVIFGDGDKLVENPSRAWIEEHFTTKGDVVERAGPYNYWFEVQGDVAWTNVNYDAIDSSPAVLWNQNITFSGTPFPANVLYVHSTRTEATNPCIKAEWDMSTSGGAAGTCTVFKVRMKRANGTISSIQALGFPIPTTNELLPSLSYWCPAP